MKLREKTMATLLIAIFMISIFIVAVPVFAYSDVWVDDSYSSPSPPYYLTIQEGIAAVSVGGMVHVLAGTYDEQVLIGKSLTLEGEGESTVIQPSDGTLTTVKTTPWIGTSTKQMASTVFVDTANEVTVRNLKIDVSELTVVPTGVGGGWVAAIAYLETSGTIEGLTVVANSGLTCRTCGIWASAVTETTLVEVTGCNVIGYNRAGIYALGETMTADYHHNEINGPGAEITQVPNGMFFLEGAIGSATYNTVTDLLYTGETYRSTGIGTYRPGTDLVFAHNEISYVQNAFAIAGGSGATIEYNYVHDCHTGVKLEAIGEDRARNVMIQYNDITDNDFAIRCGSDMGDGNAAHYNNIFGNLGDEWPWGPDTWVGDVCNVHETYTFDATLNYWGRGSGPTGPTGRVNKAGKEIGQGDSVSGLVNWDPYLPQPVFHTPLGLLPPGLD